MPISHEEQALRGNMNSEMGHFQDPPFTKTSELIPSSKKEKQSARTIDLTEAEAPTKWNKEKSEYSFIFPTVSKKDKVRVKDFVQKQQTLPPNDPLKKYMQYQTYR